MRRCLLLVSCLLLFGTGCSDERSLRAEIEAHKRQISELRRQNAELKQQAAVPADSLVKLLREIRRLEAELQQQKKLQPLLMDNRIGLWEADEQAMHIHFAEPVPAREVSDLVAAFNGRYTGSFYPQLRLLSVDGAVARVGVSDDMQLTERMGTAGSGMYIATMTYTLTSLPSVDSVYLDIREGSHAGPGYLSRARLVALVQEE